MQTVGIPKETPPADPFEGFFSTQVTRNKREWVCICCGHPPKMLYLTCGDSRYDDTVRMCNCIGARKIGFDRWDCQKRFDSDTTGYLKDGKGQYLS